MTITNSLTAALIICCISVRNHSSSPTSRSKPGVLVQVGDVERVGPRPAAARKLTRDFDGGRDCVGSQNGNRSVVLEDVELFDRVELVGSRSGRGKVNRPKPPTHLSHLGGNSIARDNAWLDKYGFLYQRSVASSVLRIKAAKNSIISSKLSARMSTRTSVSKKVEEQTRKLTNFR